MSDKKVRQLRLEQERLEKEEQKKRAQIYAPLFSTKPKPKRVAQPSQNKNENISVTKTSNPDSMMGLATKAKSKVYTGNAIIGIAVMHKSNLVPIFNSEAAVEVAQMRRG
jgi:hypothetical protein